MTRNLARLVGVLGCLLLGITQVVAQQYSFVYIQGDKTLPFYVKLGGEMLPRYGKNYSILPMLEAGDITIEILFQQNKYPSEHFTIKVPENGSRSFLLTKKDNAYSLYDLQQGFYLMDGNSAADDHLPSAIAQIPIQSIPDNTPVVVTPERVKETTPEPKPVATAKKKKEPLLKKEKKPAVQQNNGPQFIDNIELNNQHQKETPSAKTANTTSETTTHKNSKPILSKEEDEAATVVKEDNVAATVPNSDCPNAISDEGLEKIYKKAMAEESEESRTGYLLEQADHCFSTAQLRLLARSLDSETARYALVKKFYPRVTDQANFPNLEDLFASEDWKNYFRQLINK